MINLNRGISTPLSLAIIIVLAALAIGGILIFQDNCIYFNNCVPVDIEENEEAKQKENGTNIISKKSIEYPNEVSDYILEKTPDIENGCGPANRLGPVLAIDIEDIVCVEGADMNYYNKNDKESNRGGIFLTIVRFDQGRDAYKDRITSLSKSTHVDGVYRTGEPWELYWWSGDFFLFAQKYTQEPSPNGFSYSYGSILTIEHPVVDWFITKYSPTENNNPIIDSISPNSGPIGTIIELKGENLMGFESDRIVWIENSEGEKGILYAENEYTDDIEYNNTVVSKLIKTTIKEKLCQEDNSYSGLPCTSWMNIVPGIYNIYTEPWGKKSNSVEFTVTSGN